MSNTNLELEIPEETTSLQDVQNNLDSIKDICQAMNDKGFKCSRRQKDNNIYCGKHNSNNDHVFDDIIQVSIKMINGTTYYVNKCGVVLSYNLDNPIVIGYLKDNKFFMVSG